MAELRLSDRARSDLIDIRDAGVHDYGEAAAERHLLGIRRLFELLVDHPSAGQERPEFAGGIRALSHRPHRILYAVAGDIVLIVRVIHQARDVRRALQESR